MNFLSLSKPFKFSLNCLKAYGLFSANKFYFSRRTKSTQLILFNNEEIEKIHMRQQKKKKTKSWEIFTEQTSKFKVSLVGLPNCGKSSLFNCLVGQRLAIVDKQYGLTRDRRQITILKGLASVIDTPGVEVTLLAKHCKNTKLKEDIFQQTLSAISQSNIIFFIIDSKKSITQDQISLARYLKAFNFDKKCQIILVCNKCDGGYDQNQLIGQTSSLGFQKIFFCSAQEGTGIFQLLSYIDGAIPEQNKSELQKIRRQRKVRFEELVKKLKSEIKQHNEAGDVKKSIKIKQWENDFRKINPDPQENQDLDYQNFQDYLVRPQQAFSNKRGNQVKNLRMKSTIKICFIGRPNVGKSSLINQILGSQKLIVSDIPHTTRDSLATKIIYKNRKIELIDTAGLNTPRIQQNQQQYLRKVQISTMLHVQESHVVVYVLDAFSAFKIDDFKLIQRVIQQGRPVIIVVNKWEVIKQQYKYKAKNYLMKQIDTHLGQLHGYPIVYVSAKLSNNLDLMMDKIVTTYDKWNSRISTGLLNNWLQNFKKLDNLPKDAEMTLKINYLIQARVRPPHYIFFVNNKAMFKDNYLRFVAKNLAEQFQMDGIPLRHSLRSTNNNQNKLKKKTDRPKKFSKMRQKMEQLKKKYGDFSI